METEPRVKSDYDARRRAKDEERARRARGRKMRSFAVWGAGAVLVAGSLGAIIQFGSFSRPGNQSAILLDSAAPSDHTQGNASSSVVLVEYGDYQCPACALYDPAVRQVVAAYGGNIAFVYRNFPLRQIHRNADAAARAAEAAGRQNKFWEMHNLIYDKQKEWESQSNAEELFVNYARTLGLDITRFETDRGDRTIQSKIDADLASGMRAGLQGTPTFFLNGNRISPRATPDDFRTLIDPLLPARNPAEQNGA